MTDNKAKVDEKGKLQKVADSLAKSRAPGQPSPVKGEGQPKKP
jgi:hypothetical protein